jgi:hypothetical protein
MVRHLVMRAARTDDNLAGRASSDYDADMHGAMLVYLAGEKQAGVLAAAAGLLSLAAALSFLAPRLELRSFAITLGVLGLLEVAIGVGLWLRTGPQVARLSATLEREPARFRVEEGARMRRVQRNFAFLEYGWIVLVSGAALTAVLGKHHHGLAGAALALGLHVSFLLCFDVIAERRGSVYLDALERAPG